MLYYMRFILLFFMAMKSKQIKSVIYFSLPSFIWRSIHKFIIESFSFVYVNLHNERHTCSISLSISFFIFFFFLSSFLLLLLQALNRMRDMCTNKSYCEERGKKKKKKGGWSEWVFFCEGSRENEKKEMVRYCMMKGLKNSVNEWDAINQADTIEGNPTSTAWRDEII